MKITTWSVMAGAALALVGCADEDFDTPWLLNHVRILAMRAEPPQPATGQTTTLRALVYQPPAGDDSSKQGVVTGYRWSWCPFGTLPDHPDECPIKQETANMLFAGIPGVPTLDLGHNETATFTNPFPSSLVASLCQKDFSVLPALSQAIAENEVLAQNAAALFRGCGIAGYPITIQLVVDAMVAGKPKQLPAIFRVYLPVNDAIPSNQNPVVGAINIVENGARYALDEAATWSGVRDGEVPLLLDLPLSSAEPLPAWEQVYPSSKKQGAALSPREQLNVSWFTEGGTFGADHMGGRATVYYGGDPDDPVTPFSRAVENTLNPYKMDRYRGKTARVYVVVNDIRSGVSWTTGVLRLVDSPENRDGGVADAPPDVSPDAPPDTLVPPDAFLDAPPDTPAPPDAASEDGDSEVGVVDAMGEVWP